MSDGQVTRQFRRTKDVSGQRFGLLVAIEPAGLTKHKTALWKCRCDCGKETVVHLSRFRPYRPDAPPPNCGCQRYRNRWKCHWKHGKTESPEFEIWEHVKRRCLNPSNRSYRLYGGRGIKICERWRESFENFLADMGPRPTPAHSVDRIDVNGHYEPGNCRWATAQEQQRNRRNNHRLTYNGETHCIAEWADLLGLSRWTIPNRIKLGWPHHLLFAPEGTKYRRVRKDQRTA